LKIRQKDQGTRLCT